jgi:hypothetical protein
MRGPMTNFHNGLVRLVPPIPAQILASAEETRERTVKRVSGLGISRMM